MGPKHSPLFGGSIVYVCLYNILVEVRFRFEQPLYMVNESDGTASLAIVKDGVIGRNVDLNFATSDGSAISVGENTQTSIII